MEFKEYIENSAKAFSAIDKKQTIRIISHMDADGICSAGILTKALIRDKKKFSVTFTNYITKDFIVNLSQENHKNFVFLDLGTSQLKNIKTYLKDRNIFVLDHHVTRAKKIEDEKEINYFHIDVTSESSINKFFSSIPFDHVDGVIYSAGATTNKKNYGRLAILASWRMNIKKIADVSPNSF